MQDIIDVMRGYTIWSPPFTNVHGGVRALHSLKNEIVKRGYSATMHYEHHDPNNIVVYPEIVSDNPLNSPFIVRWLLNRKSFSELSFGWVHDLGAENLLTVNIIELDIFHPRSDERSGTAYWIGKGNLNTSVIPEGSFHIVRGNPDRREDLANLLASKEYLISFDDFSAINIEATLLGTPVIVYSSGHWTKEQMEYSRFGGKGICWSIDDLPKANEEVSQAYPEYLKLLKIFDERIDKFIEISQNHYQ